MAPRFGVSVVALALVVLLSAPPAVPAANEEVDYALTDEGLPVRVVSRGAAYFGDKGGPSGGPRNDRVLEGVLKKIEAVERRPRRRSRAARR